MATTPEKTPTRHAQRLATDATPLALYRVRGNTEPTKTLILGHALGSDRHMWDQVLELLPENVEVILWEQPGHGESGMLPPDASTIDQGVTSTARSLRSGLEDVLGPGSGTSVYVAGLSLGGMVSLAFAQEFPQDITALAMFSSGPLLEPSKAWTDRAAAVRQDGLRPLADGTMERWFTPDFAKGSGKEAVEQTKSTFLATAPAGYAQCCELIAHTDLREGLAAMNLPATVVVGEDDPGMTPEQGQALSDALAHSTLDVIADTRHMTAVQRPSRVAQALCEFLGVSPRPALG